MHFSEYNSDQVQLRGTNQGCLEVGAALGDSNRKQAQRWGRPPGPQVPALREGTCLVRNSFVSVEPAMKGWVGASRRVNRWRS